MRFNKAYFFYTLGIKNMKFLLNTTLILALLLGWNEISAQNFDKFLKKVDKKYNQGNYSSAEKKNEKFKKKVQKKLSLEHYYLANYFLNKAKINLAQGELNHFESDIISALMISDKNHGNNSIPHAFNLTRAAELYLLYGNFAKAFDNLKLAENIFKENDAFEGRYRSYNQYLTFKTLAEQGFYKDALELSGGLHKSMSEDIVKKDEIYDPQTKSFREQSLEKYQIEKRKTDYAGLLITRAATLGNQGNFGLADSAFAVAENYVRKNFRRYDPAYINYQTEHGKYELLQLDFRDSRRLLNFAYRNSKTKFKPTHYLIYKSHKNLIDNLLADEKDSRAYNTIKTFVKEVKNYHDENSYYQVVADLTSYKNDLGAISTDVVYQNTLKLLTRPSLPEFHHSRMEVVDYLYVLSLLANRYDLARQYLDESIKIKKVLYGENTPRYHLGLLNLSNFQIKHTNSVDSAYSIYKNSYENVIEEQISENYPELAEIMKLAARVHNEKDMLEKASEAATKASEANKNRYGEDSKQYGRVLINQVNIDLATSELKAAREHIDIALDILRKERDADEISFYTRALQIEAKLYNMQGQYDEAIKSIRRSKRLLRRTTINQFEDFDALITLADVNMSLGLFQSTYDLLIDVISSNTKLYGENSRFLIDPYLRLADWMVIQGEYGDSEKLIRQAQDITTKVHGENSSYFAQGLIMRAKLNQAIGDNDLANNYATQALNIQKNIYGETSLELINTLSLLGQINYYRGKDVEEVEKYFLDAEKIIIQLLGSENPLFAENLKNLGIIYLAKEDYNRAMSILQQSKKIWEMNAGKRNNINTADIDVLLGDLYFILKDYKNAEDHYKDAQRLYKKFFSDSHPKYVKTLSKLSKVSFMTGNERNTKKNLDEALSNYKIFINDYFPALSEREKSKFWNSINSDFEFYNTVALTYQDKYPEMIEEMYNNALLTKALLLNSSIKIRKRIMNSTDEELKQIYNEWKSNKEMLTNVLSMSPEELEENQINPQSLREEIEKLERELSERTEGFAQTFEKKPVTWQNVKMALNENEVAVEMVRFRYFNQVFTDSVVYAGLYIDNVDKNSKPGYILFKEGEEMENRYFSAYRNSIRFKVRDELSYFRFWKPFEDKFGLTKTIYLSPDGVFNQLNLEAIPTPDDRYVIDNSNIILVNNTKDIYFRQVRSRLVQEEKLATLVGNPKFYVSTDKKVISSGITRGSVVDELPGTEKEISDLTGLLSSHGWNIHDFVYDEATEESIKDIDNPKLFHIATHGFFTSDKAIETNIEGVELSQYEALENPLLRTGLMLRGAGDLLGTTQYNYNLEAGILTAYEAMNLNLDRTELVVLSACETGLGDIEVGEGVYGLQRAFLVAGSETIIMSLFKVSDQATQELMVTFYDKWLATGNKRQSFIEAKKEIRNKYKYPIYWGAFVMIGLEY